MKKVARAAEHVAKKADAREAVQTAEVAEEALDANDNIQSLYRRHAVNTHSYCCCGAGRWNGTFGRNLLYRTTALVRGTPFAISNILGAPRRRR